jgi:hypothetical protein
MLLNSRRTIWESANGNIVTMAKLIQYFLPLTYDKVVLFIITFFLLYVLAISTYRLFLHPSRRVPGPRLAAVTQ